MSDTNNEVHLFYRDILDVLEAEEIPTLVGGAFAQEYFTGISRYTKDLDLFIRETDVKRAIAALNSGGYHAEIKFCHWLAKAYGKNEADFVDIIFNSGNGLCKVDDLWFDHALSGEAFGRPVKFCPVEEALWQKAFIMERERYDGADIAHLLHAQAERLDWHHLLRRFGRHWRVLLSYLTLFGYIYPTERSKIPCWVQQELLRLISAEVGQRACGPRVCAGTLLSRSQFLVDIELWGYHDIRCPEFMTPRDVENWTAAAAEQSARAPTDNK